MQQGGGTTSITLEDGRKNLVKILNYAVKYNASDVHLKPGSPPLFRLGGKLTSPKGAERLSMEEVIAMAMTMASERKWKQFEEEHELDLSYGVPGLGRFRVNIHHQRGSLGIAIRAISSQVPDFESLNLPKVVARIAEYQRGMVLVTGATSSGKSSTLAAMVEYVNQTRADHIVTIEDPIEYLFSDKKSCITQREVGMDTLSFGRALKYALRQDPDVILMGELRDLETIETAITAAETGHLVMSTVHTTDAAETITRILSTFPESQQPVARMRLAGSLKGVISQRLVPRADKKGRILAAEIMINTAHIKECILDPSRTADMRIAIAEGGVAYGMQTFDQSLTDLVKRKLVAYDVALEYATNPSDFALQFSGISMSKGGDDWQGGGGGSRGDQPNFLSDDFDLDKY